MHRKRKGLVMGLVLSAIAAAPAVTLAATGNSLKIHAPSTATVGHKFHFYVSGTSSKTGRGLSIFVNTGVSCPQTYKGELNTQFANTQVSYTVTKHVFSSPRLSITPRAPGKHYICAYLYSRHTGRTVVHASHKYVTSR